MMITIYGRRDSSNVQAVMWGAAELGLTIEQIDVGHRFGGTDTRHFRAMNPNGTVPVLCDGDLTMFESCAILRYLAANYGDGGPFWPEQPIMRAPVDQWAEWAKHTAASWFTEPIFWLKVRTKAADRDEAALTRNIAAFEDRLAILADQIGDKNFVMGLDLSLADILAGHILFRWFDMDIPRKPNPVIEAYFARLTERAAYRLHVMVPYNALRAE